MVKRPGKRRGAAGAWIACAVGAGALGSVGAAQSMDGPVAGPPASAAPASAAGSYTVYWYVGAVAGTGWADGIDFRGVAINRHIEGCGLMGLYPVAGPHIADADPTWLQRHLARLDEDIAAKFPDATFDGPIAIDWENWMPEWRYTMDEPSGAPADANDRDFQTDWREHIRATRSQLLVGLTAQEQERVFEATYEDCAKTILVASIQECKRVRPSAKWGFYSMPSVAYWDVHNGHLDEVRASHDRLQALWDASDVLFPGNYQGYETDPTLPPRDDANRYILTEQTKKNTPEENEAWIAAGVQEAVRVAHGKPVYPFVWARYMPADGTVTNLRLLNDTNLRQMVEGPRTNGANGIVVWDYFYTALQSAEFRDFFDRKLGPRLMAVTSPTGQGNVNFRLDLIYRQPDGRVVILHGDGPSDQPGEESAPTLLGDLAPMPLAGEAPAAGAPSEGRLDTKVDTRAGARAGPPGGGGTKGQRRPASTPAASPAPPLPPAVRGSGRRRLPIIIRTVPDPEDPGPPAIVMPPSKFRLTPPWAIAPAPEEHDPS